MTGPPDPWPSHLDALNAAPEHHRLLLDNPSVRVLETRIEPGETVRLHTHRWPAVYYIASFSDFVRRDEHANMQVDTRQSTPSLQPGQAAWSPPVGPHTLENIGSSPLHVISVEARPPSGA